MADTPILMPQLGESVTEGTIAKWFKKPGDRVEKYEALAEVITDKVNAEVPSPIAGVITKITAPEGATVGVKQEICRIDESGAGGAGGADAGSADAGGADSGVAGTAVGAGGATADAKPAAAPAPAAAQADAVPVGAPAPAPSAMPTAAAVPAGVRYSPAVLRLAQEHAIDLTQVHGSGLEGRVTRKDVLDFLERRQVDGPAAAAQPAPAASAAPGAPQSVRTAPAAAAPAPAHGGPGLAAPSAGPGATDLAAEGDQVIEPTPVRRRIAEKMQQSVREAPHAWMMLEADLTNLVRLRDLMKEEFKRREGISLTYLPFVIKAVVEALREFPLVNSAWIDGKIVVRRRINMSIAVATEDALVVPVIKDADQKSIVGLAHAVVDLAGRARAGKLTLDDISGGTFTVDNTGSFGSIASMPIINPPQAGIITIEAIVPRPVVRDEAIAIRQMANLCMSLDHRVLDGLVAGRFMQSVRRRLESFNADTSLY